MVTHVVTLKKNIFTILGAVPNLVSGADDNPVKTGTTPNRFRKNPVAFNIINDRVSVDDNWDYEKVEF